MLGNIHKTVGNNIKKRTRIIIGLIFLVVSLSSSFYFLPKESELYMTTDISNLQNTLLPISIALSIIIASILFFKKPEYNGGNWSRISSIGYIGIMSYLIYSFSSSLLTTVALKMNRVSETETLNKNFVISTMTFNSNGQLIRSEPWVIKSEDKYEVRGKITGKSYDDNVDGIFMSKSDYAKIEQKKEFGITLRNGLFEIPYEPTLKE
jgi:hypothetical protein